jgi:acyl-CoA dehydrogenase
MNYPITEEQTMFLHSLRAFLEKEIYPYEAECDRAGEVPLELGEQIKQKAIEMGFSPPTCQNR